MQPRNLSHSGAQGFIELEGSSAARVAVEWVAQPAGCSITARAQEDGPVIWEALSVLQERQLNAGRLKGGEPELDTKEQYGQDLQNKLRDLHERLKTMRYRHQPIRRVHIPKEKKGQTRPIGISATEDKVVQNALREVLEAVYEQTFMDCSYGFRPGRSAHDAVRALTRAVNEGEANWILEFDVVSFFDSVRRSQLLEILQERVADGSLLRLIGTCLHVGVLDGEVFTEPSEGTVQGSTLSPMLGNVYLHTVLDRWFAEEVRPRLRGKATFIRFADDGVFGFERQDDAERVQAVLSKRMERFGLTLHPEKTRLLDFRRPLKSRGEGRSPTTFDFLGFCWYWRRTRAGSWAVACKARRARVSRA